MKRMQSRNLTRCQVLDIYRTHDIGKRTNETDGKLTSEVRCKHMPRTTEGPPWWSVKRDKFGTIDSRVQVYQKHHSGRNAHPHRIVPPSPAFYSLEIPLSKRFISSLHSIPNHSNSPSPSSSPLPLSHSTSPAISSARR